MNLVLSTGNTSVPDISGQDESTAKKTIEDAGLKFKRGDDVTSAEVEQGKAVSSDPAAGSSASAGDTITVHFSSGAAATPTPSSMVTVPKDLNGKTADEAAAELQKLGLNVTQDQKASKDVDAGKVIGTDPKAGTQVPAGSTVNLTVSTGKDGADNNQQPGDPNPGGGGNNNGG